MMGLIDAKFTKFPHVYDEFAIPDSDELNGGRVCAFELAQDIARHFNAIESSSPLSTWLGPEGTSFVCPNGENSTSMQPDCTVVPCTGPPYACANGRDTWQNLPECNEVDGCPTLTLTTTYSFDYPGGSKSGSATYSIGKGCIQINGMFWDCPGINSNFLQCYMADLLGLPLGYQCPRRPVGDTH